MDVGADQEIGSKETRIGVMGPYGGGGKEFRLLKRTAQMISKLGFSAVMGKGFYLANQPNIFHPINEITPLVVRTIKAIVPSHIFYFHFPRLTQKSVFFMNVERGQSDELRGCIRFNIPVLGFILHENITSPKPRKKRNCIFLRAYRTCSVCLAPFKELCSYDKVTTFCPFYDSIDISWSSKELFLTEDNLLLAAKKLVSARPVLREFLSS